MRVASLYESEALEQKNRILGQTRKELDEIEGEREQRSAEIRGDADAKVIEITARAFGRSPEFYRFLRQLEAYNKTLGPATRLVLSTENDFLHLLHGPGSEGED
jgi:membrane protease subunit HflC